MAYRIFIVEDNPADFAFLKQTLLDAAYEITSAQTGESALVMLGREHPDLVIMDILLPDIDGFEVCRRIRENEQFVNLPVLFYTTISTLDEKLLALEMGAADFLTKSTDRRELLVRIAGLLQAKKKIEKQLRLSFIDGLTEVYNRRYFQHRLSDEYERSSRYKRDFSCAIIDIDRFKQINDTYGHPAGDEVLKKIARQVRRYVRNADIVCRYGGDEFGVLFPETDLRGAFLALERVRERLADLNITQGLDTVAVSVSCGVSAYGPQAQGIDAIIAQADSALYAAKRQGRNQTQMFCAQEPLETPDRCLE